MCINDSTKNLILKSFYAGYIGVVASNPELNFISPDGLKNGFVAPDLLKENLDFMLMKYFL